MSSEDVEVGIRIRFEGDSKSIGARITQHAISSTRFDVLAYTVDTLFAQLRSEFASLPQGESQQRADAGKASGIKIAELERENAELRHSEENLAATVRGLEFELEKAQKTAPWLGGTVEALGDANDRLTIEITALREDNLKAHQMACAAGLERDRLRDELAALRKDKERLDWLDANDPWEGWEEVGGDWIVLQNPIRSDIDAARAEQAKQ